MAEGLALGIFEHVLQLLGGFVGISVAYIAAQGYKETRSPTLLRLSIAFLLLGFSFSISGFEGFVAMSVLPQPAFLASSIILLSVCLETLGYFFLAFSHMMSVRKLSGMGVLPVLAPPLTTVAATLKSLSIYFLLYATVETFLSYRRNGRAVTFVVALALAMLAIGEMVRWVSLLYPTVILLTLASLYIKLVGFFALFIPVVRFVWGAG